jgi:hypothetical protein
MSHRLGSGVVTRSTGLRMGNEIYRRSIEDSLHRDPNLWCSTAAKVSQPRYATVVDRLPSTSCNEYQVPSFQKVYLLATRFQSTSHLSTSAPVPLVSCNSISICTFLSAKEWSFPIYPMSALFRTAHSVILVRLHKQKFDAFACQF